MRVLFLITAILFFDLLELYSHSYYFSSSAGSDSNSAEQAMNPDTPWKSIDKLNQSMGLFEPGDFILFKRGDIFIGQIIVSCSGNNGSNIVFGAYGDGEDPILSGFIEISNWTETTSHIWEADGSNLDPATSIMLINGVSQQIGRFPNRDASNGGYLTIESHNVDRVIINSALSNTANFEGADAIIRTRRWLLDRKEILSHDASQITLKDPTRFTMIDGFGFFIQNHLKTLDQTGEWFHDVENSKVYIYDTTNPNSKEVLVSAHSAVVSVFDKQYLEFQNLQIEGAYSTNLYIENSDHISIKECYINNSGMDGIVFRYSSQIDVQNSRIRHSKNNALRFNACDFSTIRNNKIENVGLDVGMGSGQSYQYTGIVLTGNNNLVEYNQISSTGYNGIHFLGDFVTIRNNLIEGFCIVLDDGGGIYTSGDGTSTFQDRLISSNLVLNGIGAGEGTNYPSERYASGIYMDDRANDFMIKGNSISNCSDNGIFIHNSHDFSIIENTSFNNDNQIGFSHDYSFQDHPITGGHISENIFYAKTSDQSVAEFLTIYRSEITSFGVFDNNYYCRPTYEDKTINIWIHSENQNQFELINLDEWKAQFNHDLNSEKTHYKLPTFNVVSDNGVNLIENGSFGSDVSRWHCWSSSNNCGLNWSNSSDLDGGSMQLSTTNNSNNQNGFFQATGVSDRIDNGEKYVLRFSAISSSSLNYIKAELKDQNAPYGQISNSVLADAFTQRGDYEVLFMANAEVAGSTVNFIVDDDGAEYWIDNIELVKAVVELEYTEESIVFLYNATGSNMIIDDGSYYTDVAGRNYQQVTIEPFKSEVLLRTGPGFGVGVEKQDSQIYLSAYPNPSDHTIYTKTDDDSLKQIKLSDHLGRVLLQQQSSSTSYEVDVSDLSEGIYVLTQEGEKGRISTQLIIR